MIRDHISACKGFQWTVGNLIFTASMDWERKIWRMETLLRLISADVPPCSFLLHQSHKEIIQKSCGGNWPAWVRVWIRFEMVLYQPTGRQSDTDTFKVAILFFCFVFIVFSGFLIFRRYMWETFFFFLKIALMTLIVPTCIMELIQVKEQNSTSLFRF